MLFLAPKWRPTIFVPRSLALREAGLKGERGLRAPLEKVASFSTPRKLPKPPRHVVHDDAGVFEHREEHRRTTTPTPPLALTGRRFWLKALDFTGQGAGPRSNGAIISSPIET